jgi:D-serine dehydratase
MYRLCPARAELGLSILHKTKDEMIEPGTPPLTRSALSPAFEEALRKLDAEPLTGVEKGLRPTRLRVGDIGKEGWNILDGDVPLPAMVIRWADVQHNIALMQSYCDQRGAWLAPHGKTTMAPQLWAEQLRAGAWSITVANVPQLQVCRAFGMQRIFVANELVSDYDIRYLGQQLHDDPDLELYALVDSVEGVERLNRGLRQANVRTPLKILLEFGMPGGRCGVRALQDLEQVADAVLRAGPVLRLAGVEGYEGIVPGPVHAERRAVAERYLRSLAQGVRLIRPRVPASETFLVSAGGSVYFDQVVEILGRDALPEAQLVLRSGGYVTHDSAYYERSSPLGSLAEHRLGIGELHPALEVWSVVLSRPEPDLAILSMGGRDMPTDIELPIPLYKASSSAHVEPIGDGYKVFKSNDQHAYLRLPPDSDLSVGDLVGSGISHPCTAFDKWRNLLVVDSARKITGAVRTFF